PAASQHLPAQPRVLVHLEHVDAGVGDAGVNEYVERLLPGVECLAGEARDQVDVQVRDSCCTETAQIVRNNRPAVQTPAGMRLAVNEGLHTKADAVYARRN